jgi:peptide/nickel transport system permease protein
MTTRNLATPAAAAPAQTAFVPTPRRARLSWLRQTPVLIWACLAVLCAFVFCAAFADALAPHDPTTQDLRARLRPPLGFGGTADYPLGTDPLGRDVLSRLLFGARVSLAVGVAGMLIGLVIGGLLGLLSGFVRGPLDEGLMFFVDVKLAVPFLVIALTAVAVLGREIPIIILLAGVSGLAGYMRVARGIALGTREQQYILAARAVGAGRTRLLLRHILPNAVAPMVVLATFNLTEVIFLESSLSFLGVGVKPPTPSWGSMLSQGRDYLHTAWWIAVFPGIAIVLITMSISLSGDWLRDTLDPALRGARGAKSSE